MSLTEGLGKSLGVGAMVAALALGAYFLWKKYKPFSSFTTDTNNDNINDAGTGVIDVNKPLWEGSLISNNPFTGKPWNATPDSATIPPATTEIPWYLEPVTETTVPAFLTSREPITTAGYEAALAGTSNLVTGSAAEAYANAQRIRELAAVPDYPSYASVMTLLGGESYKSYQVSPTQALGINRYGWDVHYTTDTGPWHEGQISAMNSGGSNPFGNKQFTHWLNMAESYGGV